MNTHAQDVVNAVEVERPKIIKQTGQKPIIQEKINQVTKHIKVPLSQFTGKVVDIFVVARREVSLSQHLDQVIDVPVVLMFEQFPHVHAVARTAEIPQITDKVIDVCSVGRAGSTSGGRGGGR